MKAVKSSNIVIIIVLLLPIVFIVSNIFAINTTSNSTNISPATKDSKGNYPSDLVKNLIESYKTKDFTTASKITTGKMGAVISQVIQIKKKNAGKTPHSLISFANQLDSFKVLGELEWDKRAIVSLYWTLKLSEKYNPELFYTKISYIDYFLKKDSRGEWKIADAKFKNEKILYNPNP